ncbi:MAG: tyrosine-type recombinase/integrase [Clostridia bacterium]|nr:tyrosine-type recombinase/integrase [Clostridia bacterium]
MALNRKFSYLREYTDQLPDFVTEYLIEYYTGESINTQIGYAIDIRVFFNYLKSEVLHNISDIKNITVKDINNLKVTDLIRFKSYLREYEQETHTVSGKVIKRVYKNSAYGINRKMSAVRGMFIYLYKTEQIKENITDKVDFAKLHQKIKKRLTSQETCDLLDVIYNGEKYYEGRLLTEYKKRKLRDTAIFTTYLGTGIRVSELINLNIEDLDLDTNSFIVTRKGGDQQEIFMPQQVKETISEYLKSEEKLRQSIEKGALFISRNGKRFTTAGIEKLLKNYCKTVSITNPDKTRPHALRRTFACQLLEDGVDIKMVAELLGHKNIEVTHKYYAQYNAKARKDIMLEQVPVPAEIYNHKEEE